MEDKDDIISEIDFECSMLEDVLHGKEGERITRIRKLLVQYLNTKPTHYIDRPMEISEADKEYFKRKWKALMKQFKK